MSMGKEKDRLRLFSKIAPVPDPIEIHVTRWTLIACAVALVFAGVGLGYCAHLIAEALSWV